MRDEVTPDEPSEDYTDAAEPVEADEPEAAEVDESEAPESEPQQPVKDWSSDDEEEARLFGWKSPDEWQGDKPPGYIDNPQRFLDRVKNSRIFQTMQQQQAEMARKLDAVNSAALEKQKRDYEAQIAQISANKLRAVEEADTDAYERWDKQEQDLRKNAPQEDAQPDQQEFLRKAQEAQVQFKQENPWAQNPAIWKEAKDAVQAAMEAGQPFSSMEDQFTFAKETILTKYPHLADMGKSDPKPQPRARVDGGGLAGGPARKRDAFDGLPSEVKEQFMRDVKRGTFKDTKEDRKWFAEVYNNG